MNSQKICFLINSRWEDPETRGSAIMRGYVPATHLTKFTNSYVGKFLPHDIKKGDIVIFVKDMFHRDLKIAKSIGCICVYDPIDDFSSTGNEKAFDVFIASSESHAKFLCTKYKIQRKKIIIIDHLHTNIKRKKNNKKIGKFTIGCVEPKSFLNFYEKEIRKICEDNSANFFFKDFQEIQAHFSHENGISTNFQNLFKDIDIAISLFEKDDLRTSLKPSTKLTNYASFGIPTVCSYQSSYDKIIRKFPEFEEMIVENLDDGKELIKKLINDQSFYENKKKLFNNIGENFHMDRAYELYVKQINFLFLVNQTNFFSK